MNPLRHTGVLPTSLCAALQADFDTLKPNRYKDGQYRLRRYSQLNFQRDSQTVTPHYGRTFVQSGDINTFQGNVMRQYDDLTESLLHSKAFAGILATFSDKGGLPNDSLIEVHQIRIISRNRQDTVPTAPEGIHQDGFQRIGMFTINHQNATGGALMIYEENDENTLLQTIESQAGAYCVMDDSHFWHYATPLVANQADTAGFWDLFVFTSHGSQT